jgi:hypothetical protein
VLVEITVAKLRAAIKAAVSKIPYLMVAGYAPSGGFLIAYLIAGFCAAYGRSIRSGDW